MSPLLGTGGAGWLASRAMAAGPSPDGTKPFFAAATNSTAQQMIINQFRFAAAKSIRTSTIILATFNAIAAFATAVGILYDSYSRTKRNNRSFSFRRSGFSFVPSGEVYPLSLSLGIIVQSATFAVAQSTGLDRFFTTGCSLISQVVLPAIFLAPFIQLVFAVEITTRALRAKPFTARGKWAVSICLTVVAMLILVTFLVAGFIRTRDFCFASLFLFVAKYATGCFAVLTGITVTLLACTATISTKLYRSIQIDVTERVDASRMVYYLALAIITNIFMLPFFFVLAFPEGHDPGFGTNNESLTLSMVAAVVANVSGVMMGGLYLFLKSNSLWTIGPRDKAGEYDRRRIKYNIRRYDTGGSDSSDEHIMQPMSPSGTGTLSRSLSRTDSEASLIQDEKEEEEELASRGSPTPSARSDLRRLNPLRSNAVYPSARIPRAPEPAQVPLAGTGHLRKRSYSLFPHSNSRSNNRNNNSRINNSSNNDNNSSSSAAPPSAKSSVALLPATTYSPNAAAVGARARDAAESALDLLKPPPSIRNLANRHRRDSSMVSSATVQIGLRLSSVDDMVDSRVPAAAETEVSSLGCPRDVTRPAAAATTGTSAARRPSPLGPSGTSAAAAAAATAAAAVAQPEAAGSIAGASASIPDDDTDDDDLTDEGTHRDPVKDARMKTLPPVPRTKSTMAAPGSTAAAVGVADGGQDDGEMLSPSVYDPESPTRAKLPSPRGVGFAMPAPRSGSSSSNKNETPSSPPPLPCRNDGEGPTRPGDPKDDWI